MFVNWAIITWIVKLPPIHISKSPIFSFAFVEGMENTSTPLTLNNSIDSSGNRHLSALSLGMYILQLYQGGMRIA